MKIELNIINPMNYPFWDELLLSNHEYSFFHSSNWARVLCESYHYNPLYFTLTDKSKLLVSLPIMEIKSFLTGQRGVSLPFSDYCDPIVTKDILFQDVFDYLIEYGVQAGWKFIEIRGGGDFLQNLLPSSYYYAHFLELSKDEEQIFSNLRSSTRRNIKKAFREGVEVNVGNSIESIKEFYRLNCVTRKMHGLPPQPYYFFKKIYEYIIVRNLGIVVIASYNKRNIAGAVFFHFGEKAMYKYGASDRSYQELRPNNLVMWEAIKWYCQKGFKTLCFGRTEPENRGLRQFKAGWSTKEKTIQYYRYDLKKGTFIGEKPYVTEFHNKLFNKMPTPLLRTFSLVFYKHMG